MSNHLCIIALVRAIEQWWVTEVFFELSECRGTLVVPCEIAAESFEERQTFIGRSGYEPVEGQYFANEMLHLLCGIRGL